MTNEDEVSTALEAARAAADAALDVAASADTGTALVPQGADAALAVKSQMTAAHALVAGARRDAMAKVAAAREAIKAQQAELDRQARALEAELAPLQSRLDLMQEGIWTMNLYLGRDEEIVQLASGEPAPAGTPIHVRQQVLAMDEESMISAETGGIDFRHVEAFDEWVTSDPRHLDQVLPETRGVVAIMPRRSDVSYGDAFADASWNAANKHAYWLIRNGENVYRMDTPFETGPRLVPARNEFTSMFIDPWTKQPLEPGSQGWLKAEKAAGARERHFMRVALILQGLIDRTHVFHPLPKAGVSLLSPQDYDDGHVVLIADDENQLTTGRVGFYTWLEGLNSQLRTGMRVMVATAHSDWPSRSTNQWSYDHHPRITPPKAEAPASGQVHVIKRAGSMPGEFVITYPRTREKWIGGWDGELRAPKTPASCTIRTSDKFVIPVDLVDIATMQTYLHARTERHAYLNMVPTLRAAIEFKEAEAAAEAPFRDLLAAQVAQAEGIDVTTAHAAIDPVIATWKVGARWFRPMQGDPKAEARAAREILAERARIVRADAGAGDDAAFVDRALREHPDALLVARKKDGTYVVLTPSQRAWTTVDGKAHLSVPHDVWVDRHEYTRGGKARPVATWQLVRVASTSRWVTLHEGEAWATWKKHERLDDHLTDPEICDAVEQIREHDLPGLTLLAVEYDEDGGWHNDGCRLSFTAWYHPGPVPRSPRPLTEPAPYLYAQTVTVLASRATDGSVHLRWGRPRTDSSTAWHPPFNSGISPLRTAAPEVPWESNNHRRRIVHVEPAAIAQAKADADAWEADRLAAARLGVTAERLEDGAKADWTSRQLDAARARFLDDFADEAAWAEREAAVQKGQRGPWTKSGKESDPWWAARFAIRRLVETGRSPWGMTIARAVALLGEPLDPRAGSYQHDWWRPEALEVALSEEIASLLLPDQDERGEDR